jgi:transposase
VRWYLGGLQGHDKSWVSRRLMLAERLDPELQEQIRLGLLSATVAREISRLPRGNQPALARAIQTPGVGGTSAHDAPRVR